MIDRPSIRIALLGAALLSVAGPGLATAKQFSGWSPAVAEAGINTAAAEGCPIESPNGLELALSGKLRRSGYRHRLSSQHVRPLVHPGQSRIQRQHRRQ